MGSDGSRIADRIRRSGYEFRRGRENAAGGQYNPAHAHNSLMKSEGHRNTILQDDVYEYGSSVAKSAKGRLHWTQVFGSRSEHLKKDDKKTKDDKEGKRVRK